VWVRDESVLLRDDQGHPIAWHGLYEDITEQKETEERLREAESRFRTLVEQIPAVTYIDRTDERSTTVYVSPQVKTMFGYSTEAWVTGIDLWIENMHPDDQGRVLEALRAHKAQGVPLDVEYRFRTGDGRWMWAHDQATIVLDADGSRLSQGVMYDITARRLVEEQLRDAEKRYRTLVEALPAVVYRDAVDEKATTIYVSGQTTAMLGYTPEDWRSDPDPWLDMVHPDDRPRIKAANDLHKNVGDVFDEEYRLIRKDGQVIWVHDVAVVVGDEAGRPLYSQGFFFDVTKGKLIEEQLRDAEQRYRALVEHIPAMLYIDSVDEHAPSIYVSPQSERVLGVAAERYMADGDLWLEQIHPDDRQRVLEAYRRSLADAEGWAVEYRAIRPDNGEVMWVRDESVFLFDANGQPALIQGVVFDVTERKLAEEALQDSERREREAAERLRALDEMKNRFLAAVSHELRSPLASILGAALTVARPDIPDEDRADLLDRLAQNARKLDRLLSDLIDIDRLNRGILTPVPRPTDLGALVRRTIETLDILGDRSIRVEAEPVVVPIEAAKVERIVENLIANAVRHTGPDVRIWVRVSAQDDGAFLAVEDDGPGIPEDLREAIFEPFRQGPKASSYAPGTGIGLSLVAMFAELHGGRAWVEDRPGGGSSFRVFFPAVFPADTTAEGGKGAEKHIVDPDTGRAG
jgi:PAS domain S-box-containing protein